MSPTQPTDPVVVLNPQSGSGDHADDVTERATARGFEVRKTAAAGDAVEFARDAAEDGSSLVVAAGGDGTLNEVVRGVAQADALDDVTVGVVPVGTGNNFASNVGIDGVEDAFEALDDGERRRIDLGRVDGHLFVNSCVAGLTAEASGDTTADMKSRLGVLAYALSTLRDAAEFDGLRLTVSVWEADGQSTAWSGNAACVLIGNGRRFSGGGSEQANMEDGLFDVTVVEEAATPLLVEEMFVERLFGRESSHTVRLQAPSLEISVPESKPVHFSLDGEMVSVDEPSLRVRANALEIPVGDTYRADPATE